MPKLNWNRLFMLAGLVLLVILLLRGCFFACAAKPSQSKIEKAQTPVTQVKRQPMSLYLHREKRTVQTELEEYLVGVTAAEMPASFNEEALKAQAVAARTYSLRRIAEGGCSSGADLCSQSSCCQAYRTEEELRENWGDAYEANIKKIRAAVSATAGEALYYEGELIEALYHAASGGMTEDSENVFASAQPYLRSVKSSYEIGSSHITDEERYTRKEFTKAINAAFPKAKLKESKLNGQIEIQSRFESGRVKSVKLGAITATGRELRGVLELRSAWFSIEITSSEVIISTRGYGHGVGMSQAGANGMAEQGHGYKEILEHYYSGAEIDVK